MHFYNYFSVSSVAAAETKALGQCVGGWPRISSEVKALRKQAAKEGAAFWFLDAGG
jgi:hypothetical protein